MTDQYTFIFKSKSSEGFARLNYMLANLPQKEDGWKVIIAEHLNNRSIEQNDRMWAILTEVAEQVADETGKYYSPETWHSYMKAKFLGKDTIVIDGSVELVERSSKKLKVKAFADYMTQIEAWAVEHGVNFRMDK